LIIPKPLVEQNVPVAGLNLSGNFVGVNGKHLKRHAFSDSLVHFCPKLAFLPDFCAFFGKALAACPGLREGSAKEKPGS